MNEEYRLVFRTPNEVEMEQIREIARTMRDIGYAYVLPPDRKLTFIRLWPPSFDGDSESQEYYHAPTPR
jgi:hypothetical protein